MNHFWRNLSAFTRRERRGALIFAMILIIIIAAGQLLPRFFQHKPWFVVEDTAFINQWTRKMEAKSILKLQRFNPNNASLKDLTQMGIPASIASSWVKYLDAGGKFYNKSDLRKLYGMPDSLYIRLEPYLKMPARKKNTYTYQYQQAQKQQKKSELSAFNPNTYSKKELTGAGLPEHIASNIINYRKSGGEFRVKKDLLKIYVIDSTDYNKFEPFIELPQKVTDDKQIVKLDSVELNSTTIEELKQLHVKAYIANSIINYRDLLGGFFAHHQLKEVYYIDTTTINLLKASSWIDTLLIKPVEINKATENQLSSHPYITRNTASQIRKYRDFAGEIANWKELHSINVLDDTLARKLRYYLLF